MSASCDDLAKISMKESSEALQRMETDKTQLQTEGDQELEFEDEKSCDSDEILGPPQINSNSDLLWNLFVKFNLTEGNLCGKRSVRISELTNKLNYKKRTTEKEEKDHTEGKKSFGKLISIYQKEIEEQRNINESNKANLSQSKNISKVNKNNAIQVQCAIESNLT